MRNGVETRNGEPNNQGGNYEEEIEPVKVPSRNVIAIVLIHDSITNNNRAAPKSSIIWNLAISSARWRATAR
jgi:hypothetical protein